MRNLMEYPVTHNEIIDFLKLMGKMRLAQNLIGDMGPVLIDAAINHVESNRNIAIRYDGKIATVADIDYSEED